MYAVVVWLNEDTLVPSVIGPYHSDAAFDYGTELRQFCHKVQVCQMSPPKGVDELKELISSTSSERR